MRTIFKPSSIVYSISFILFYICCAGAADFPNNRVFTIEENNHSFHYMLQGNVDYTQYLRPSLPPAKRPVSYFKIENIGSKPVKDPRIWLNGFQYPLSTKELVTGMIVNPDSLEDSLLNIFYSIADYTLHRYPDPIENADPLLFFLSDLSGVWDYQAMVQANLWSALGLRYRFAEPGRSDMKSLPHAVYEVENGDRRLHLDTDFFAYYLLYDNFTIASTEDIRKDPMLVTRSATGRNYQPFPVLANTTLPGMSSNCSESVATMYHTQKKLKPFTRKLIKNRTLSLVLRSGESYRWHTGERHYIRPRCEDSAFSRVHRDVTWETRIDFNNPDHLWCLSDAQKQAALRSGYLALKADEALSIDYDVPWPVIGCRISLSEVKGGTVDPKRPVTLSLTAVYAADDFSPPIRRSIQSQIGKERNGFALEKVIAKGTLDEMRAVVIDRFDKPLFQPLRKFTLRIGVGKGVNGRNANLAGISLDRLHITLFLQSTSWALRELRKGDNQLVYSDASADRKVKVDVGSEPFTMPLPEYTAGEFAPSSSGTIPESRLLFHWPATRGGPCVRHQLQISAFKDMRYPLSPTFDRLIENREGPMTFKLPWPGMLPVNKQLYWRVRPLGAFDVAGAWTQPRVFRVTGPGPPENVTVASRGNKLFLTWNPPEHCPRGTVYEIHASRIDGFFPVSQAHHVYGAKPGTATGSETFSASGWPVMPSTFLKKTGRSEILLFDPQQAEKSILWRRPDAHFRVIAIDRQGARSCPSPQAHLTSPHLLVPERVRVASGPVHYSPKCISSLGRVTSKHYFAGLWDIPKIQYAIEPDTGNWQINADTGELTGNVGSGQEVTLQLTVTDQFHQSDSQTVTFQASK